MIGTAGGTEVCLVAGVTIDGSANVFVIRVALCAGYAGMPSGKRIAGVGAVIEFGAKPACGAVANGALVGQTAGYVRGIGGGDEILLVTCVTGSGRALVSVVDVASNAVESCVDAGEGKAG